MLPEKEMYAQVLTEDDHLWIWWRNGKITRDDEVVRILWHYDRATFYQMIHNRDKLKRHWSKR